MSRTVFFITLMWSAGLSAAGNDASNAPEGNRPDKAEIHVYEVVEQTFTAKNTYTNPYLDVDLWVTLKGPGGTYRIPAFWDGGNTFRVRLVATRPGEWTWSTGSQTGDDGLDQQSGRFSAAAWSEAEKLVNPNRRGFIKVNGKTLQYADGTPFFLAADTRWTALTGIYHWDSGTGGVGMAGITFQDMVALRKAQGFNGIGMISGFPSDKLAPIWDQSIHGKKHAEDGSWPFEIIDNEVDFRRINPAYWQQADRKFAHMWAEGFVPYLETLRRSEQLALPKYSEQQSALTNFVRYLWARYGCYNMVFSWIHMDAGNQATIDSWKPMIVEACAALGNMPYGQPRTLMAPGGTVYERGGSWHVIDGLLDINSWSNTKRNGDCIADMRDMFRNHPLPVINVEPYYPGWTGKVNKKREALSEGQMAQFLMYGCVLNGGGLVGHLWGDNFWGGVATAPRSTEPYAPSTPHAGNFSRWDNAPASMGKLKEFMLDPGHDYRVLEPAVHHLADQDFELLCLALAPDKSQGLGFVAAGKDTSDIIGLAAHAAYHVEWWHIDNGGWQDKTVHPTDASGRLDMPGVPGGDKRGWAFRMLKVEK